MRSAKRNDRHGKRSRGTLTMRAWLRLIYLVALGAAAFGFWASSDVRDSPAHWLLQSARAQEQQAVAFCFDVALPISDTVEKRVTRRVEQAISKLPKNAPRAIFVFEFNPASGTAGEGSSFGDALDLARFISGDRLSQAKVKTV